MKRLYISDLDGTLLGPDATLSKESARILTECIENGAAVTVATGRSIATVLSILKDVPFNLPLIMMNGVVIYDPKEKKFVRKLEIPEESVRLLKKLMRRHEITGLVYRITEEGQIVYYESLESPLRREFIETRRALYGKRFDYIPDLMDVPDDSTVYFCLLDPYEKLSALEKDLKEIPNISWVFYPHTYRDDAWFLEIYHKDASKYSGVLELLETYSPEESVGFGDNLNDLPLLKACDRSYAVANALEEVKDYADDVIPSNREDGVARFIQEDYRK